MNMKIPNGLDRTYDTTRVVSVPVSDPEVLLRRELGEVLREYRNRQGRTLREVSSQATVSLGYLSEVERGQKEASSELLASICRALNVPLSHVLRLVADRIDLAEGRIPPSLLRSMRISETPDELIEAEIARF
ncbi:MAG: helix-turn-helix domain-containing protein [Actinomycetaceae bacterium]|nr:helix-turn-helix domain-containing protein [Actinomycetaceae bacterium]